MEEVVQGVDMDEAEQAAVATKSSCQESDDAYEKVERAEDLHEYNGRLRPCEGDDREAHTGQQVDHVVSGVGDEQPMRAEQRVGNESGGSCGVERSGENPGDGSCGQFHGKASS